MTALPRPDLKAAARHLRALTGEDEPVVCLQAFADRGRAIPGHRHGTLGELAPWLAARQAEGCGVFVAVNETDGRGRRRANVVAARASFVDLDGAPLPDRWPVEPHLVVETSPGRFHAYWRVERTDDLDAWSDRQARLAAFLGGDPSVTDPPRVARLAGFWHQKGEPFLSRIVSEEDPAFVAPLTLADMAGAHPCPYFAPAARGVARSETPAAGWNSPEALSRARGWIAAAEPAVEGALGNNRTFATACVLRDLGVSRETALDLMDERWSPRCSPPWDRDELEGVVRNAYLYASGDAGSNSAAADFEEDVAPEDIENLPRLLTAKNPMGTARRFIAEARPTLMRHSGDWLAHAGDRYEALEDDTVKAELYAFVSGSFRPDKRTVAYALDALAAAAHRERDAFAPPCWLEGGGPDPRELLSCRNGLLHLPTMTLHPQTPRFFTRNGLGYDFAPDAPPPTRWLSFLREVWPGEPELAALLQEVTGYLLLPDTSLQKMFVWDGPTRGGKGTWGRVLFDLIGPANCCAPPLAGFGRDPILASLVGKQLALVSDMRLDRRSDLGSVAGNLLRITGQDPVTFDRKYKDAWTGTLQARIVVLTNLGLGIPDVSGALTNRMVPIVSHASFLGAEDPGLGDALRAELPGILAWAIEGRRRLAGRGRFELPEESRRWLARSADMASPLPAFLRERCVMDPDATCAKDEAYAAWEEWAMEKGAHSAVRGEVWFARDLLSAARGKVRETRPRAKDGGRVQSWQGIRLRDFLDDAGQGVSG